MKRDLVLPCVALAVALIAFFWPYLRGWYEAWRDDMDGWYLRRRLPCLLLGHRRSVSKLLFVGPHPTRCRCTRCGLRWERADGGRWKRIPPQPRYYVHLRWHAWDPVCPDFKEGDVSLIYGKTYQADAVGHNMPVCPTCKDRNAKHMKDR